MSQPEIPRYRCHKEVRALKISYIDPFHRLIPVDTRFEPIQVDKEWIERHKPQSGGYYVIYEDGYTSYSPAQAFELGYSIIYPALESTGGGVGTLWAIGYRDREYARQMGDPVLCKVVAETKEEAEESAYSRLGDCKGVGLWAWRLS